MVSPIAHNFTSNQSKHEEEVELRIGSYFCLPLHIQKVKLPTGILLDKFPANMDIAEISRCLRLCLTAPLDKGFLEGERVFHVYFVRGT